MDYVKACKILTAVDGFRVNGLSLTIDCPLGFVFETYTDEIKEAIECLSLEHGFTLN
jgi:hypothetical protein